MSTPKKPQDRLPKVARRVTLPWVLDGAKADAYEDAQRALKAKKEELESTKARRAAAVRAMMPASVDPDSIAAGIAALKAEDDRELDSLRKAAEKAEAELDECRIQFVFRALPRAEWKALRKAHPAKTDEDRELWEANGGGGDAQYSLSTITADLLAKAIVEPKLSRAAIDDIVDGDEWNDSEVDMLRNYALLAQGTYRPDPKGSS